MIRETFRYRFVLEVVSSFNRVTVNSLILVIIITIRCLSKCFQIILSLKGQCTFSLLPFLFICGYAIMIPTGTEKYFNVKGKNVNWKIKLFDAIWLFDLTRSVCLFLSIRSLAKLVWAYRHFRIAVLETRLFFFFLNFRDYITMSFPTFSSFLILYHNSCF